MLLKNRVFSGLGSTLEWFDFALYGFFGSTFSKIFFPEIGKSAWLSLVTTYAIFSVGFAARPVGSLIFGYIGDKYGRLFALRLTPILITLTTVAMGLLPTYNSIGGYAILFLLITRIVQGILLGGEFGGNIVYLCESSTKWKYFWGSIGSCSGSLGIILASGVASIFYAYFSPEFMFSYGWRIAFLLSIPLGVIATIMRFSMSESPEFHLDKSFNPLMTSLKYHKKTFFYCLGLIYLHATSFYFVFMFLPVFLIQIRHLPESAALLNNTGFLILHLLLIPVFGVIVNFTNGFKSIMTISLIFILTTLPIFYWIAYGSANQLLLSLFIFSITTSFNAAVIPGLLSQLIISKVRYTILSFVFNVGFGVFGGIMPFLGLLIIEKTGNIMSPAIYLTFVSFVTFLVGYYFLSSRRCYEIRQI